MSDTFMVTATGTEVGKTFVSRALTVSLAGRRLSVTALKPVETGCAPEPLDAHILAAACGKPHLAHARGFYRATPPLAPQAAFLHDGTPPPMVKDLAQAVRDQQEPHSLCLVEGAGGLLVPLNAQEDFADLAAELKAPLIMVAPDKLGVLSHALTALACAAQRGLSVLAVVLVQQDNADSSTQTNAAILRQRSDLPVLLFPHCEDNNSALAHACESCGLTSLVAHAYETSPA